ncbi:MAG: glycosyltransferase family 39 protein [Pirellulales bacterium]
MGLNVVSLFTLILGLAGLLHHRLVFVVPSIAVLAVGAVWAYRTWRAGDNGAADGNSADSALVDDDNLPVRRWWWLAVPLVALLVAGGMMPPVEFDVREYHLQAPKEFYQSGSVHFLAENVYGNMPLGAEMLALAAMATLGDWWYGALVGKLLIASFALLTAVDLWALGRRYISDAAGVVAALVYLSTPWILRVSMLGLIDAAVGFYTVTAIHALLLWHEQTESSDRGLLATAGFLAGAAAACKYPALLMTVAPLTLVVAVVARRRATALGIFLAAALLACGPWLAKNYAMTGNPVYPLLGDVFGTAGHTREQAARWQAAHRPPNFAVSDIAERAARVLLRSEWLGLLTVPLAVLGAWLGWRDPRVRWGVAYLVFVLAAWWLATHRIDRFLVPALPVVALLAGAAVGRLSRLVGRHVMSLLLAVACLYAFLVAASGPAGDNRFLASLDDLRHDPQRVMPWRLYLNEHAGNDRAVLSLGDAEVFDFEVPVDYHTAFDACPLEVLYDSLPAEELHGRDTAALRVHLRQLGRDRAVSLARQLRLQRLCATGGVRVTGSGRRARRPHRRLRRRRRGDLSRGTGGSA